MKKEMEGILGREGTQPAITSEDGKTRLIYNLFDGFTGKNVKLTIEEIPEEEETEELDWDEVEEESGDTIESEEMEAEEEGDEETEDDEGEEEIKE